MGMLTGIAEISKSQNLTDGDIRVLMRLFSLLDYNNYLSIEQKSVAEALHRSPESVSRSIKRLTEQGVIHRGPRVGRAYTYRLDPFVAFRGETEAKDRVAKEIRDRQWKVYEGGKEA